MVEIHNFLFIDDMNICSANDLKQFETTNQQIVTEFYYWLYLFIYLI